MAQTASLSGALQNVGSLCNLSENAEVDCGFTQALAQCRYSARLLRRVNGLRSINIEVVPAKPPSLLLQGLARVVVCSNALAQQLVTVSWEHQGASNTTGQQGGFGAASSLQHVGSRLEQLILQSEGRTAGQDERRTGGRIPVIVTNAAEKLLKSSASNGKRPTSDVAEDDRLPLDQGVFLRSKKQCLHCEYIKNLRDFPKLSSSTDGRHEVCRACYSSFKAIRLRKELHHLGMTVAEAWEKSKECAKCGEVKELRDYSVLRRNPDGLQSHCRSCESEAMSARPRKIPTDASQICGSCNVRKPASAFGTHRSNANGLNKACRTCRVDREMVRRERKATLFISRTQKLCLKCNTNKAPNEFAKSTLSNDGLTPDCKQCKRSRMREHRERAKLQPVAEGT